MSQNIIARPLILFLGSSADLDEQSGLAGQFACQRGSDELPLEISIEALPDCTDELRVQLQEAGTDALIAVALHDRLQTTPRILIRAAEVARLPKPSWLFVPAYRLAGDSRWKKPHYELFDQAALSAAMPAGCLAPCLAPHLLICRAELLAQWLGTAGSATINIESLLEESLRFLLEHAKDDGYLLCGEGSFDTDPSTEPTWSGEPLSLRELAWLGPIGRHALPFLLRSIDESP